MNNLIAYSIVSWKMNMFYLFILELALAESCRGGRDLSLKDISRTNWFCEINYEWWHYWWGQRTKKLLREKNLDRKYMNWKSNPPVRKSTLFKSHERVLLEKVMRIFQPLFEYHPQNINRTRVLPSKTKEKNNIDLSTAGEKGYSPNSSWLNKKSALNTDHTVSLFENYYPWITKQRSNFDF